MSRVAAAFARRRGTVLIPYLTVGHPNLETTLEAVPLLEESGADLVELGIPFSDPVADGVTIQEASFRALQGGVTPGRCLEVAARLRERVRLPLLFLTYFNPILSYGLEAFCAASARAGVDGLIVPDLPPEEAIELEEATARHGLDLIYLLAPTSTEERVRQVAQRSRGFIYLVSVTGVTGARESLPPGLGEFVARVRKWASQPLCVGFGISTPEQAAQVARIADGVIVGSRLVQLLSSRREWKPLVSKFVQEMKQAMVGSTGCPGGSSS
ncbi:MAG: tryptophan synthase subunit alpha [Bacillota bacterium]